MTKGKDESSAEMVELVVQLVTLSQDLIEAKMRLEEVKTLKAPDQKKMPRLTILTKSTTSR